jgi:molecular chaperone DnaK (HSP70)
MYVFEGPWHLVERNRSLGPFAITGIPPAEAGEEPVRVTFKVDLDGGLNTGTTARVLSSGTTALLTFNKTAKR